MDAWWHEHAFSAGTNAAPTASTGILSYGGGISGVGVMTGQNKVYLVIYGNQWGTQGTDANGNLTFTNDAAGAAVAAQKMFKGIGTNSELWQAELTQWCEGVASGTTSCPNTASFIPYQQNIFAGIWYDNAAASPASATAAQLATEANKAAAHFGNTTTAANRYAYYVILSAKGTNPDNYQSPTNGYCAWHDYTSQSNGLMAYSNQPYNIDQGASCGVGFVNAGAAGTLDGYTMTLGHEWQEMMSDQFPAGGWTNHTGGTYNGQENSDECAWIAAGSAGGAANIAFSTGTFAQQASWSNDTANCAITHAILTHGGGNSAPVANFSFTTSGLTATFTDSSTDSDGTIASRSWNFGDGATSTATNPSHTYATANTYSVSETVTDNLGATNTKTSSVTVSGSSSNVLQNGVAVTGLSATTGNSLNYTMVVPAGATGLSFVQSGGTGDSDMYVKFGSSPTDTVYDCRPYVAGNAETCNIATAQAGTYYIRLKAYSSFTGVSIKGSYTTGGGGCGGTVLCSGTAVSLPSVATGGVSANYTMVVPAGKTSVVFTISGGTGDADLYVNLGSAPTTTTYSCRPYTTGNAETCTFNSPTAGTYYVNVRAYAGYSGVSLKGTISP